MRTIILELPDDLAAAVLDTPDGLLRIRDLVAAEFGTAAMPYDDSAQAPPVRLTPAGAAAVTQMLDASEARSHPFDPEVARRRAAERIAAQAARDVA